MTDNNQYLECPDCNLRLLFRYDEEQDKYIAMCPYCREYFEITEEKYFEFEE